MRKLTALFACWMSLAVSIPGITAPTLNAVCNLERPVTGPHGKVSATVLAEAPDRSKLQYEWKDTGGRFEPAAANKSTVQWDANGAAAGSYTLTANVIGADGAAGACELHVMVGEEVRSAGGEPGSEAARALLVNGTDERKGYGLYSYILFAARPDAAAQARYEAVLKDYLQLEDVKLEKYFKLAQLNVTYVPVTVDPPDADNIKVDWTLAHYDYARARALLAALPKREEGDGPFIVSSLHPLQERRSAAEPYISQNLSSVPLSVIPFWMKQFRSETTQQRVWEGKAISSMALNLRTAIAIAAEGAPMVQKAVKALIVISPAQ